MKRILSLSTLSTVSVLSAALLAAGLTPIDADAASRRVVRPNAAGGTTTAGAGAWHGPYGGYSARAGSTSVNPDGSASHRSGFSAVSGRGTVQSTGSATRDASGQVQQSRSTVATSAVTGNSVHSSTSYGTGSGITHTATCYSASGAVIACR